MITTRRAATITSYPGQIGVLGSPITADLGTTSVTASLRDDEETKRSNGYQRAFLVLSLTRRAPKTVLLCNQESISSAVFTTALPGLAPASSARASAANHRKWSAPHSCGPARAHQGKHPQRPDLGTAGKRITWQISPLNHLWGREKVKFDHLGKTKDLAATTTETRTGTSHS